MGLFNNFPYPDTHQLNLDWILNSVKELSTYVKERVDGIQKALTDAQAAATAAENSANSAQTFANNAQDSAESAQDAATAQPSVKQAEAAATAAENSANSAQTFANNAQTSATSAQASAENAQISVTQAQTFANNAHTSATSAQTSATIAQTSATIAQESATKIADVLFDNAGAHNAIYRGKNLGKSVTAAQWAAIANGSFTDLYIGDYWVIGGVNWRIAAFDYYYKSGDTSCTTHHVVIVPDSNLYNYRMNDTNITTNGYIGSKMYKEGLEQAKTTINNAFGSSHILSHRQLLVNAVTNGKPSDISWYDSTVELMTEQNVYGGKIFGAGNDGSTVPNLNTIDKSQFPLFAHNPSIISNRQWFWLRDVVSAARFATVDSYGNALNSNSSYDSGVRPAFSIKS